VLLRRKFKTFDGARKRAAFESAHCGDRWVYEPVRCIDGKPDPQPFDVNKLRRYTWRLNRR
jgi:hypothetical protein